MHECSACAVDGFPRVLVFRAAGKLGTGQNYVLRSIADEIYPQHCDESYEGPSPAGRHCSEPLGKFAPEPRRGHVRVINEGKLVDPKLGLSADPREFV